VKKAASKNIKIIFEGKATLRHHRKAPKHKSEESLTYRASD
jgi:hypothetical protein